MTLDSRLSLPSLAFLCKRIIKCDRFDATSSAPHPGRHYRKRIFLADRIQKRKH